MALSLRAAGLRRRNTSLFPAHGDGTFITPATLRGRTGGPLKRGSLRPAGAAEPLYQGAHATTVRQLTGGVQGPRAFFRYVPRPPFQR